MKQMGLKRHEISSTYSYPEQTFSLHPFPVNILFSETAVMPRVVFVSTNSPSPRGLIYLYFFVYIFVLPLGGYSRCP